MKKINFRIFAILITSILFLTLVGCGSSSNNPAAISDTDAVAADVESLAATLGGTDLDLNNVTTSLLLSFTGDNGSTITWSSSNPAVLADNGTVTRPPFTSGDATITLTATITKGADTQTKIFTIIVLKAPETNAEAVAADKANVVDATLLGTGSTGGTDLNHVTGNLTLPVLGSSGSTISWSSNNLTAIANDGTVTLPSGTNSTVILTATFTKGSVVETKTFTIIVLKYDFNVTFDSQSGSAVDAQLLASESLVTKPADPTRDDNVFSGWYTEEVCTTAWNFASDTVDEDIVLYAKWTPSSTGITYTLINEDTEYRVDKVGGTTLSGSIVIPGYHEGKPVTAIADHMFYLATGLTSITLPTSLTTIGDYAFTGCTGLTSISIQAGVTTLGRDIFYGCTGLTSLTLPGGLTSIGIGAIRGCSNLTAITIPNGVTSLGDYALEGNSKLTSITIPGSVTTIGGSAFSGCTLLANVVVIPSAIPTAGATIFGDRTTDTTLSIIVPDANKDAYKAATGWITYAARITSVATQATVNTERDKITAVVISLGAISPGGNALTMAQSLVKAGYTVSIVSSSNEAVITASGSVVGAVGTSSDVVFQVTKDGFTSNTAALTITIKNINLSGTAAFPGASAIFTLSVADIGADSAVTGSIVYNGSTYALTGNYIFSTGAITASNAEADPHFVITGIYSSGTFSGTISRTIASVVTSGTVTAIISENGAAISNYLGVFAFNPDMYINKVWNFTISGSKLIGTFSYTAGSNNVLGKLEGTVSGNTITLTEFYIYRLGSFINIKTNTGGMYMNGTGSATISGTSVSGTWAWTYIANGTSAGSGTFSGTEQLPLTAELTEGSHDTASTSVFDPSGIALNVYSTDEETETYTFSLNKNNTSQSVALVGTSDYVVITNTSSDVTFTVTWSEPNVQYGATTSFSFTVSEPGKADRTYSFEINRNGK